MNLKTLLKKHSADFGLIFPFNYRRLKPVIFDFSKKNQSLSKINLNDPRAFTQYTDKLIQKASTKYGLGQYLENRTIYDHSPLFSGGQRRTVHLGIDIWVKPNTKILAPLKGSIHSLKNNQGIGDYGPTIILKHQLENTPFYTLYGHLSKKSLKNKSKNQKIKKGQIIGWVGNYPDNGHWPPHLHFQIISDMNNYQGDFPGVCALKDKQKYQKICPNPNLILQITTLQT